LRKTILAALAACSIAGAQSPLEFGRAQLRAALTARGANPALARINAEYSMALPADAFSIQAGVIRGGSLRGLLYGLLEAAAQVRRRGSLWASRAEPRFEIRGARLRLSGETWRHAPEEWRALFESLSECRLNRLKLEFDGLTASRADTLAAVSAIALEYAMDLAVAPGEADPALLSRLLAESPAVRAVEAVPPASAALLPVLAGAGRFVVLETEAPPQVPPGEADAPRPPVRLLGRGAGAVWKAPEGEPLTDRTLDALASAQAAGFELALPRDWTAVREQFAAYADLAFQQSTGVSARRSPAAGSARKAAPKPAPKAPAARRPRR
jgi:hypothetical protein